MSGYFVDSSALAKRYLTETVSLWVRSWVIPEHENDIIISALTTVEVISLLMRREREGFISPASRVIMQNDFLLHVETEYMVIALDDRTLALARELLPRHRLRSLDALQLACALRAERAFSAPLPFITAAARLLEAPATRRPACR